ncbi:hypothetical protein BST33_15170 [Mycolicibacter minnesotensis]|uniref:Uncharacterized protein n=1 Tax=Mycolicibacter minnesotensis TaxID=1118379 RepID=A0AA91M4C5_9MYCO|nr:hypothetical protein [Mycolicibacter minnesotensis]ORA99070.1 hypothetical protein BST33_15170 [Mycolicibacter minnesotensis]
MNLDIDTKVTLLSAGLIFLFALVLGVWKHHQIATSDTGQAHVYVDIAYRAALLYSLATLLVAVFVELSAWPTWVNMTAAMVIVFFFVVAIGSYMLYGALRGTDKQFGRLGWRLHVGMAILVIGEVGGFAVLLAGFGVGGF